MKSAQNRKSYKVFISYSTADRAVALRLFNDLSRAGAQVFHFEQSSKAGSDAWNQVLSAIKQADGFVALLSKQAMLSRPVRSEVEQAYYWYNNIGTPELIPVRLEPVEVPDQLVTRTLVSLEDYAAGLSVLIRTFGLTMGVSQAPAAKAAEPVRQAPAAKAAEPVRQVPADAARSYLRKRYGLPEETFLKHLKKEQDEGVSLINQATVVAPRFKQNVYLLPALNLFLGLVASVLLYWLFSSLPDLGVFLTQLLPESVKEFLASIRGWWHSTTFLGASLSTVMLIAGALAIMYLSCGFADEQICVDFQDYVVVSFKGFLLAGFVAFAWVFFFHPQGAGFALYFASAVALSSVTISAFELF